MLIGARNRTVCPIHVFSADTIKTSTGKEGVNATFPVALTMIRAIREYNEQTGHKVGFKPAGGIKKAKDSLSWLALMKEELGDDWTQPDLYVALVWDS